MTPPDAEPTPSTRAQRHNEDAAAARTPSKPARAAKARTATSPEDKKLRESEKLWANMQEAQASFARTVEETYQHAMARSTEAYQTCLAALNAVQRDLQQQASDAFLTYTSSVSNAASSGDVVSQSTDAYQDYATAVQNLFDTSEPQAKSEAADAAYLKAAAEAQGQPDSEARLAGAYATYLEAIRTAWDKTAATQEANSKLQTWLDLLKLAQTQYQQQTLEAYRVYVEALRKAPAATDAVKRSDQANEAYVKALQDTWESARETYGNAAANTILKRVQEAWSTG